MTMNALWRSLLPVCLILLICLMFSGYVSAQQTKNVEIGLDGVIQFSYSNEEKLKEEFEKEGNVSGVGLLLIKKTTLLGYGVHFGLAENILKKNTLYKDEVTEVKFRSSYYMANLLLDLPVSFLNFTLILGGGQYSLSCKNSDCSDGAYKDAKFPRKTILSTGARVAIKIGEDEYGIYASYMNVAVGKVKLEQVQSQDVPSPQTTEYDPSGNAVSLGLSFSF